MFKRRIFVIVLSLFLVAQFLFPQSREWGVIQGKVTDNEGNPLPGVTITASSQSLMGTRSTITDQEGRFRLPALPGGNYTLQATLEGFTPVKKENVVLHVGTTVTVDITLLLQKLEEEVVVTGAAPLVDIKDASLAKTFLTREVLQNVPNPRNVSQIFLLSPAGVPAILQEAYVYGGSRLSNSYQLDGVELMDSWAGAGTYTAPIDYDVIEEAQIVSLGTPAEYGNYTGAAVNIITKSGGNFFSGDVQIYYTGMKWQSSAKINKEDPRWSLLPESPKTQLIDPSFHLGGPIIKDKLWFFTGFEYYSTKERLESTNKTRTITFPKIFIKVTFQPNQKNRFQAFFEYHDRTAKHNQLSLLYHDEANQDLLYPVYAWNSTFLHMFSSSTIFDLKITGYTMTWDSIPSSRDRSIAGHVDAVTGEYTRNLYFWSHWYSRRIGGTAAISTSKDNFIKGSHDFKIGFEFERSPGGGGYDYNGPDKVYYLDYNGQPYLAIKTAYKQNAINLRYTFYAQDSWKFSDALTINPGIRFDIYRGSVPDLKQANKTVYTPYGFEPRIGFVWDIFKDHKTLFKAHYGRYNEATKTYNFAQLTPMADTTYYSVGPNWSYIQELYTIPGKNLYTIDPDIKHPCMDQYIAGLERVLAKDTVLTISLIYKYWFNIIDPVNTGAIYQPISFTDPETGQVYTVYNQINVGQDHYYITNPRKGKDIGAAFPDIVSFTPDRKYKAVEIALNKKLSNNWQLFASYVYSQEKGYYSSANIPGMTTIFRDRNNQINNYGSFVSSIPHIIKIMGTWVLPFDFSLSVFYVYMSGTPWTRTLPVKLNQGTLYVFTEPSGSRRLPATSNLDMRVEKFIDYKNYRLSLMLDVFNVLNRVRETTVFARVGSNFGKPTEVNAPRTFRLCAKISF